MSESLRVKLKKLVDNSYDIVIGEGVLGGIAGDLVKKPLGHRYVIISDSEVMKLYGERLAESMKEQGLNVDRLAFPAGEKSKSRRMVQHLQDNMLELGLGRDAVVIACGGGVTGDLAGFVAATYYRGVPCIQVPTTLLAMADSAVGGKTGVNMAQGKNLIGAFHQPARVYVDLLVLSSLPRRQYIAGLAEVVKHAVIRSREFFGYLEDNLKAILARDQAVLTRLIKTNCTIKADVVSKDERESNLRQILNYGHTLGHAIEAVTDYTLLHGEAVAMGLALEGRLACELEIFAGEDLERQNALLKKIGLPVSTKVMLKGLMGRMPKAREIMDYTKVDKKSRTGRVFYVFPSRIGRMKQVHGQVGIYVEDAKVLRTLNYAFH